MTPLQRSVAILALVTASCAGRDADFYVHDTAVLVDTAAPFADRPELPARLESTVAVALAYWGGSWRNLRGRSITLTGDPQVSCRGSTGALGCYDGDIRVTTTDPGIGTFSCVEETVLVHEIGHAVIGDPRHEDPRWMLFEPVEAALSGRTGFTATGEGPCTIYVSVWRHPLGVP